MRWSKLIALMVIGMLSTPAWALFDVSTFYGIRSGTIKEGDTATFSGDDQDYAGSDINVAAHLHPWLVPIGVGGSMSMQNYKFKDDVTAEEYTLKGTIYYAEVNAWLPIKAGKFVPYVVAAYALSGELEMDFTLPPTSPVAGDFSYKLAYTGFEGELGVRYMPLPMVSLNLGYRMGLASNKLTPTSLTFNSVSMPITGITSNDITAGSINIGLGFKF